MKKASNKYSSFQKTVWDYYKAHGRHDLPWRQTRDPYRIWVSEIMLQQTQVPRVIKKYKEFLNVFPTVFDLAKAPLIEVLKMWIGLGYNRRAKYLKNAAEVIIKIQGGTLPKEHAGLMSLPGIGDYTASAIRVFAHNEPDVLIETNIRTVFIHHFYFCRSDLQKDDRIAGTDMISDKELLLHIGDSLDLENPREWYWALMDYGSYLKKQLPNPSRKSGTYTKQSKFEGSLRQVRGAILKIFKDGPQTEIQMGKLTTFEKERIKNALAGLVKDNMIKKEKGKWGIA